MREGLPRPVFGGRFRGSGRHERVAGRALVHNQVDILACGPPDKRNAPPDDRAHAANDGDISKSSRSCGEESHTKY